MYWCTSCVLLCVVFVLSAVIQASPVRRKRAAPAPVACSINAPEVLQSSSGSVSLNNYQNFMRCEWKIVVPESQKVKLTLQSFAVEDHSLCEYDGLRILDGPADDAAPLDILCGTRDAGWSVESTGNSMFLIFYADASVTGSGFDATFEAVTEPGTCPTGVQKINIPANGEIHLTPFPSGYKSNQDCEWEVEAQDSTQVLKVEFLSMDIELGSNCGYDSLSIHNGGTKGAPEFEGSPFCGTALPAALTSSGRAVFLNFKSDGSVNKGGFSVKVTAESVASGTPCEGGILTATDEEQNLEPFSPEDAVYANDQNCDWLIQHADANKDIQITFVDYFEVEHRNADFTECYDAVFLYDGPTKNDPQQAMLCGNTLPSPASYVVSGSEALVHFNSDNSEMKKGFKIMYKTVDASQPPVDGACTSGSINSAQVFEPFSGVDYANDQNCEWTINAPGGKIIRLEFQELDIENGNNCGYDSLVIHDGDSKDDPEKGKLCGTSLPDEIVSSGNKMLLVFKSDFSVQKGGFKINILFENPATTAPPTTTTTPTTTTPTTTTTTEANPGLSCTGGTLTAPATLEPFPGADYANGQECEWVIRAPNPDQTLKLRFVSFNVEFETNCAYDSLTIHDGDSKGSPIRAKHCGDLSENLPPTIMSRGNALFLAFISDGSVVAPGFKVEIETVDPPCPPGQWSCRSGDQCIPEDQKCDNTPQCNDGSDEELCNLGDCGVKTRNVYTKIVGGTPTDENAWPWMATMIQFGGLRCGASLINEQWVLTAAHCTNGFVANNPPISIRLGEHHLGESSDAEIDVPVSLIVEHPDYNDNTLDNDMALLKLQSPVTFREEISPVCLTTIDNEPPTGTKCTVTGWGAIYSDGPTSQVLLEVDVPIILPDACRANPDVVYGDAQITDNMVCAGNVTHGGIDSCQGDSGGPLVCQFSRDSRWHQVGVVSWGYGCAAPNRPGIYARVSQYTEWINSYIST